MGVCLEWWSSWIFVINYKMKHGSSLGGVLWELEPWIGCIKLEMCDFKDSFIMALKLRICSEWNMKFVRKSGEAMDWLCKLRLLVPYWDWCAKTYFSRLWTMVCKSVEMGCLRVPIGVSNKAMDVIRMYLMKDATSLEVKVWISWMFGGLIGWWHKLSVEKLNEEFMNDKDYEEEKV